LLKKAGLLFQEPGFFIGIDAGGYSKNFDGRFSVVGKYFSIT
jgi:hypothetical protein